MPSRRPALPPVPAGEAIVLLTFESGQDTYAELFTALHPATGTPLRILARRITDQTGVPVNELAGRRFAVAALSDADADGFTLLDDPRL
ncbi:hypothetical protein [Streptosporangium sp. NPDC048865]|uniref:hypothetical protein n=1 Tax=Streptosporangium sp. NPDC048865 TaxID=3155766 RepID=UPI003438BFE8